MEITSYTRVILEEDGLTDVSRLLYCRRLLLKIYITLISFLLYTVNTKLNLSYKYEEVTIAGLIAHGDLLEFLRISEPIGKVKLNLLCNYFYFQVKLHRYYPLKEDQPKLKVFVLSCFINRCETGGPMT